MIIDLQTYQKEAGVLRQRTLCFFVQDGQVLLGLKKTVFGKGNWLGIGGKVEQGESVEDAMVRECVEEVHVKPLAWKQVAVLNFYFPHASEPAKWNQQVCVYVCDTWEGEFAESDEIRPEWFVVDGVPLKLMWDDARLRLPQVLAGDSLTADFLFGEDLLVLQHSIVEGLE